ncbi:TolC family protein [Marivirga lumbricoides]|uniref:TolC family protein n=1 Tax=Marivirga lumbricoides TaxID=1046115 RepID=A0A2T4DU67_9BACT|nr:TolC family protein [Marivirga lumbricoides]
MKRFLIVITACSIAVSSYGQNTLSLADCKEMALQSNVAMRNSQLELEAMQEVKKNASTNYFPKVNASLFGMKAISPIVEMDVPGGNLPVYDGNPANLATATEFAYFPGLNMGLMEEAQLASINLVQPVYTGGRIANGNKLAKLGVDVKEKQLALTEDQVLLQTEQQYWLIVSLQEKEKTIAKYEELLSSVEKQVNDAFNSGLILKNDLLKVQLKQSELQANKSQLINGKKLATMQFCQTIGIDYDSMLVLSEDLQEVNLPQAYFTQSKEAVSGRIEYELLQKSVEAEQLQTKMAKGELMPQAAVGASGFYLNGVIPGADGRNNGLLYATISIPISDWWGGTHKVKEHEAKVRIAQNTFDDTRKLLVLQIEKGWTDVTQAHEQVQLMQTTARQAEENLRVTRDSYNNGLITVSDLLEAQAIVVETDDKLIEAKTKYRLAIATYLQLTGR